MKTKEELKMIAEKLFPYDPYRETLFPGQRTSLIDGFIRGYLYAIKELDEKNFNSNNPKSN